MKRSNTSPGNTDRDAGHAVPGPQIAILGAGPVGLEAALAAAERGHRFTVYERDPHVAAAVREWGHVRMFSPWKMNVSERMRRRLERAGCPPPRGEACPTGDELVGRVLEPLAATPELAANLRLGTRVVAVGREGWLKHEAIGAPKRAARPFRLLLEDGAGRERVERADVVLDCTGTYGHPNALGDGGIPAPGERELEDRIERRIPDIAGGGEMWAGKTVLLVGAGHSAQTAARDLAELARSRPGTRVIWALRKREPSWGAVPEDPLPERARLTARARELASGAEPGIETRRGVRVDALERRGDRVAVRLRHGDGRTETVEVDRVLSLTGYVGDHRLYRQLQVHECYATSGPMKLAAALLADGEADCLAQTSHGPETLVNPEPNFFILGIKSYGRTNTFLLTVGWSQVDEAFGTLPASVRSA